MLRKRNIILSRARAVADNAIDAVARAGIEVAETRDADAAGYLNLGATPPSPGSAEALHGEADTVFALWPVTEMEVASGFKTGSSMDGGEDSAVRDNENDKNTGAGEAKLEEEEEANEVSGKLSDLARGDEGKGMQGQVVKRGEDDRSGGEKSPAEIVWHEYLDDTTNCYYYWNSATNETTWERPEEENVVVIPASKPLATAKSIAKNKKTTPRNDSTTSSARRSVTEIPPLRMSLLGTGPEVLLSDAVVDDAISDGSMDSDAWDRFDDFDIDGDFDIY